MDRKQKSKALRFNVEDLVNGLATARLPVFLFLPFRSLEDLSFYNNEESTLIQKYLINKFKEQLSAYIK